MKHLKSFNQVNEQLFGSSVKKFSDEIFGNKKTKGTGGGDDSSKSPSGEGGEVIVKKAESVPSNAQSISGYGNFTPGKSESDPLVVVYGGTDVGGRSSGIYMYDYFGSVADRYNLFVAKDHNIDGKAAYKALKDKLGDKPSKKILYIFSGGYNPGMAALKEFGPSEFDKIYLADPWLGNKKVEDFYVDLAKRNPNKVEYYYTSFGANSNSAKNGIVSAVSTDLAQKENNHMKTNQDAITSLLQYA